MSEELEIIQRALKRERKARKAAEETLELKANELYYASEKLRKVNEQLELQQIQVAYTTSMSDPQMKTLAEHSAHLMFCADPSGYVTYANAASLQLLGYSLEELERMHFIELAEEGVRKELTTLYRDQHKRKTVESEKELQLVSKSGEAYSVKLKVVFVFDEDKELQYICLIAMKA